MRYLGVANKKMTVGGYTPKMWGWKLPKISVNIGRYVHHTWIIYSWEARYMWESFKHMVRGRMEFETTQTKKHVLSQGNTFQTVAWRSLQLGINTLMTSCQISNFFKVTQGELSILIASGVGGWQSKWQIRVRISNPYNERHVEPAKLMLGRCNLHFGAKGLSSELLLWVSGRVNTCLPNYIISPCKAK